MPKQKKPLQRKKATSVDGAGSVLSTVSGPSSVDPPGSLGNQDTASNELLGKVASSQKLATQIAYNPNKPGEYGEAAKMPKQGTSVRADTDSATASTATEINPSPKTGSGKPPIGLNPTVEPLDRVRVDGGGQRLTTNQGVPVADNQNSLKVGLRGPTAMEDFILREKITHLPLSRQCTTINEMVCTGRRYTVGAQATSPIPWEAATPTKPA
jgi:catalase